MSLYLDSEGDDYVLADRIPVDSSIEDAQWPHWFGEAECWSNGELRVSIHGEGLLIVTRNQPIYVKRGEWVVWNLRDEVKNLARYGDGEFSRKFEKCEDQHEGGVDAPFRVPEPRGALTAIAPRRRQHPTHLPQPGEPVSMMPSRST